MNVANLDLCRELYELSGWEDTHAWYGISELEWEKMAGYEGYVAEFANDNLNHDIPAYDLGYLTHKLRELGGRVTMIWDEAGCMVNAHFDNPSNPVWHGSASNRAATPQEAFATVCIELFKQGILTKAGNE